MYSHRKKRSEVNTHRIQRFSVLCTRGVLLKKPWRHGFTAEPLSFTAFKGGKRSPHGLLTSEPQSSPRRVHKIQVVCTRSVHVFRVGCSMAMVLSYVHDAYTQAMLTGRTVYLGLRVGCSVVTVLSPSISWRFTTLHPTPANYVNHQAFSNFVQKKQWKKISCRPWT